MARRCFYSFHYKPDAWRASQVRNVRTIEGNRPVTDNDWEAITRGGDDAIKRWIDDQLYGKSCAIVLVGSATANRKWINYEICKAWNDGLGVVGIHIHGLKDRIGYTSNMGANPFDFITYKQTQNLSSIVRCYDPQGADSKDKYAWITEYLDAAADEAVRIRAKY